VFLNYWLTMRTGDEVRSSEVFPAFKTYASSVDESVADVMADLAHVGASYRHLESVDDSSALGTFLYRWRTIDAGTTTPILLWLGSQSGDWVSADERDRALAVLESYLVRRMLCRSTSKDYNRLFLELLSRLKRCEPHTADEVMSAYLSEQTAESRRWPDDRELHHALLDLPLYRLLTRSRLRIVLEALEDSFRTGYSEEAHVPRRHLTIEHVMPQSWQSHWAMDRAEDQFETERSRERLIHTLGNLTLVNGRLNPALSNGAWQDKRATLGEHTVLQLNKQLLSMTETEPWSEALIRTRGALLAAQVALIWPGPPSQKPFDFELAATEAQRVQSKPEESSAASSSRPRSPKAASRRTHNRELTVVPDGPISYTHRGVVHVASVDRGAIRFHDGRSFLSPSAAGRALNGGSEVNGWLVWKRDGVTLADLHDELDTKDGSR
jgi:hypothetical protein